MIQKIPIRFFIVTFLWTWFFWIIPSFLNRLGLFPENNDLLSNLNLIFKIIGIFGPAIGALVSLYTLNGKNSIKIFFKSFLSLNFGWKVWLAIIPLLGFSFFIIWIIPELFGLERITSILPNFYIFPLYLFLMVIVGGGQEEIGWRGYILPILEKRFGLIIGSLILGTIWTIWHLPLFFIKGSYQEYMNFFAYLLLCIGLSYFFSWVIDASGNKLLSGVIAHGALNAFIDLFPFLIMENNSKQLRFWIYCIFMFIVGLIIVLIRSYKKRKYCA